MDYILFSQIFSFLLVELVSGHGRLWEPPARSTMWRRGYNTPMNPNDNELNCGGYMVSFHFLFVDYLFVCSCYATIFQSRESKPRA